MSVFISRRGGYIYVGDSDAENGFPDFSYTGQVAPVIDDGKVGDQQNWRIKFLTSGTLLFRKNPGIVDAFLVGGGGGGGYYDGGGGGGGYTKTVSLKLEANTPYEVIVGGGGEGGTASDAYATEGGASSIGGHSVAGGKPGENRPSNVSAWGGDGGSGGGCGGANSQHGGDGGSDGSDGVVGWTAKEGKGQGTTTREFGEADGQLYAGGGGGGSGLSVSAGGAGGGGNGGYDSAKLMAEAGETNTGGGGGGGSDAGTYRPGAAGGSGIVVIRNHREVTA